MDYFAGAPLGSLIYERTYSRDGETWPETVRRVVRGNLALVPSQYNEPGEEQALADLMLKRAILPGGRHLWMTGVPGRQFLANCFVAPWGSAQQHCAFMFNELMKGGGVGANYSTRHVLGMPHPRRTPTVLFECDPTHPDYDTIKHRLNFTRLFGVEGQRVVIEDTREGWVDALTSVLDMATVQECTNSIIVFDVSAIRGRGAPIRGFGGVAAGPEPLMELLERVTEELAPLVGYPWTGPACMAIDHHIASSVIAGNVRRSARMSIMHWDDPNINWFLGCKKDTSLHWSTNISVEIDDRFLKEVHDLGSKARRVFDRIVEGMMRDGEPGIFNSALANKGERVHVDTTNPCGEIALESGEPCVLGHVNLAYPWKSEMELRKAFRLMTRFLLRATHMDVTSPITQRVLDRNRRIGVGFFGLQEYLARKGWTLSHAHRTGFPKYLWEWKQAVNLAATEYSLVLGIPKPIKLTTVAPTGTIAKLAGTSEGIHPIYAKYYLRRVRYADNDPQVAVLKGQGVEFESDIYSAGTVVATFPTEDAVVSRVGPKYIEESHEISPYNAMSLQAIIQKFWADNAISHTINIGPDVRAQDLKQSLLTFMPVLKGITVFPAMSRPQSPIERITKEEYEALTYHSVGQIEDDNCTLVGCPVR